MGILVLDIGSIVSGWCCLRVIVLMFSTHSLMFLVDSRIVSALFIFYEFRSFLVRSSGRRIVLELYFFIPFYRHT